MLDYKQQYEEALERMKSWARSEHPECFSEAQKAAEFVFPELKESEDERINKEIIDYLKGFIPHNDDGLVAKSKVWIAWLEKQGKIIDEYEDKLDRCACESFDKGYKAALEKQGEQKPTDKIKPKFKVGDWITDGTSTFQIINIDDEYYLADDGDRVCFGVVHQYYHLWTIQDANKGDILQANKCTLIFDSLTKGIDDNTVIISWYYCDTKKFYGIGISKSDLWTASPAVWTIEGVVPATKEQCDLLFSKMKEAGYEWYAEKQGEPKQPNRLSKEQEYTLNRIIEYLEDNSCSEEWLDLLHEIHDAPYIKPKQVEWKLNDDDMLVEIASNLLYAAKNRPTCNMEIYKAEVDWLKRICKK